MGTGRAPGLAVVQVPGLAVVQVPGRGLCGFAHSERSSELPEEGIRLRRECSSIGDTRLVGWRA